MNKQIQSGWAVYLRAKTEKALVAQQQRIQCALLDSSDLPVLTEFVDVGLHQNSFQELLDAAGLGQFSHLAVSSPESLGTNESEVLQRIEAFIQMGIVIRFADLPNVNLMDADDRILIALTFALQSRESELISQRVRRGLQNKRNASNKDANND